MERTQMFKFMFKKQVNQEKTIEISFYGIDHWNFVSLNKSDKKHSFGDKPGCVNETGSFWYKDGLLHRENAPAVIKSSVNMWYDNGYYHRLNGPALEFPDGTKRWFIEGKQFWSVKEYNDKIKSMKK
jgi:hypothetical protein